MQRALRWAIVRYFQTRNINQQPWLLKSLSFVLFPKNTVLDIFKQYPEAAFKILELLSKDLGLADSKWTSQMDKDASERIAGALIFLQDHFEHQNWTRKEIAEWAGTTPETVIRTLAQFERDGFIDQSQGRAIRLINKKNLSEKMARQHVS